MRCEVLCLGVVIASLASPMPGKAGFAVAQDPGSSVLSVRVQAAESGRPLAGAQVLVQGLGIGGVTNEQGRIRLEGLGNGARTVEARYLGYAVQQAQVVLEPGGVESLHFYLEKQPIPLAEVRVRARPSILRDNGFYLRRKGGFGTFLTRQEIEAMQPRMLSDVLRRMAGISLAPTSWGDRARARMRGGAPSGQCPIQYYLDGTLTMGFQIDEVAPEDVEGLEIYRGAATIPPLFNKGTAMCGVIVIWTRVQ